MRAFEAQLREMGARHVKPGELSSFVEGTVGLSVDRRTMRLPSGKELSVRETIVFHLEEGEWKIVQFHASLAVSNEEAFGPNAGRD